MLQSMLQEWLTMMALVTDPTHQVLGAILRMLPGVAAALLLLLAGMVVARLVRTAIEKVLAVAHVDHYTEKMKLNEVLSRLGLERSPAFVLGFMVYWLIILVFVVSAANAMQIAAVVQFLGQVVVFMPKLIGAVLVLAGGFLLGDFLGEIVRNAATANKIHEAMVFSKVVRFTVLVFASIMALEQVGISATTVASSVQIILATVGLGLALAFGLGGRDVAADIIKNFAKR
jgi:hypothetical protein